MTAVFFVYSGIQNTVLGYLLEKLLIAWQCSYREALDNLKNIPVPVPAPTL
jgi:hypothetical protein